VLCRVVYSSQAAPDFASSELLADVRKNPQLLPRIVFHVFIAQLETRLRNDADTAPVGIIHAHNLVELPSRFSVATRAHNLGISVVQEMMSVS